MSELGRDPIPFHSAFLILPSGKLIEGVSHPLFADDEQTFLSSVTGRAMQESSVVPFNN